MFLFFVTTVNCDQVCKKSQISEKFAIFRTKIEPNVDSFGLILERKKKRKQKQKQKQNKTKQKTKQNKTKQNKTKQNKTKQNKNKTTTTTFPSIIFHEKKNPIYVSCHILFKNPKIFRKFPKLLMTITSELNMLET